MDTELLLQTCMACVGMYGSREVPLQEFELLLYEQACRTGETLLKDARTLWEKSMHDSTGEPSR